VIVDVAVTGRWCGARHSREGRTGPFGAIPYVTGRWETYRRLVHSGPGTEPLDRLLIRAGQALQRVNRRVAAEHGTTATGLAVLGVLVEREAPSQRELAGHLRLAPATLTPVLDTLEAAGDVMRVRDGADRRAVRLEITDLGRARYARAAAGVTEAVDALPRPSPEHAAIIRGHLLALLDATDRDG
jgi:DNA-binding MarR family transcriptional regulator